MSTSYTSQGHFTLKMARKAGWVPVKKKDRHPDSGNGQVLTDGTNFAHVDFQRSGKTQHMHVERFGGNNVDSLVEAMDGLSEHDEGFWEIPCNAQGMIDDLEADDPPPGTEGQP